MGLEKLTFLLVGKINNRIYTAYTNFLFFIRIQHMLTLLCIFLVSKGVKFTLEELYFKAFFVILALNFLSDLEFSCSYNVSFL